MLARTLAVTRKEAIHILRDPRTLVVIILIPIVQLVLLGYAATTDIERLRTVVLDGDRSSESRALIDAYRASGYFEVIEHVDSEAALARRIDDGTARAGLIIPRGFAETLADGETAQVGFAIDGSDPSVANVILAASQQVGQARSVEIALEALGGRRPQLPGIEVRPRVWYNAELESANFMIPGLMGIVLQFLATMLTALAIVRERELGTLEQLIVTPVRPIELVVGKVVPYVVVAFFVLLEVLLVGVLWFGVPINGNVLLLLILSGLFLVTALGMGLLISTLAHTQQEAMLLTWFLLLPSIFLSGFFFPLEAMPAFLRAISLLIPLRYLLTIMRGIILKGVGLEVLWPQVVALVVFGVVVVAIAAARFRKSLD